MNNLPDEVVARILSFISCQELVAQLKFVCQEWNLLIENRNGWIWHCKMERNFGSFGSRFLKSYIKSNVYSSIHNKLSRTLHDVCLVHESIFLKTLDYS